MQGDKIAGDLAERIKSPSAGLATRITACRILAKSKSDVLAILKERASKLLRAKS